MASNPVSQTDRQIIERLMKDDEIRAWLDQKKPRSGFATFLGDRDTWRLLLTAVIIPLLGWLALQGYAMYDAIRNKAAHDRADAEARAAKAQSETRQDVAQVAALMPYLSGTTEQRELAMPALRTMAAFGADGHNPLSAGMLNGMVEVARRKSQSSDPAVQKEGVRDTELLSAPTPPAAQVAKADAGTVQSAPSATATPPSLAYIQYYGEGQKAQANALADALRAAGVPVPGLEDITRTHPDSAFKYPQKGMGAVRYYRTGDAGAAQFAADALGRQLDGAPQLRLLSWRTSQPGVVEIWFPCQLPQCR